MDSLVSSVSVSESLDVLVVDTWPLACRAIRAAKAIDLQFRITGADLLEILPGVIAETGAG